MLALLLGFAWPANADHLSRRYGDSPDIEVWTNKGYDATYYYGEDVAVYFRAERDCYVVVYDIDPSGNITVLFPSNYYNSPYVNGGEVYRIPDYYDDYTLEVNYRSGVDHIFAVASYRYLDAPDFMRYIGYDYGDPDYYDDNYFVNSLHGDLDDFVGYVNNRITRGDYAVSHTRFLVESNYRHHRHYRYWDYDPYYVGSVWVGCNFPGAEVWIDGIYFGIAPLLIPRLYYGDHWVWIYYGGYPCYQRYFTLTSMDRYYIDVTIDNGYKDYRYRRTHFGGWHPLEKKYRNEKDFEKRARESRERNVRTRSLPSHVVRDFDKRGIISKQSPLVRDLKPETRVDRERISERRQARKEAEDKIRGTERKSDRKKVGEDRQLGAPYKVEKDKLRGTREVVVPRGEKDDKQELRDSKSDRESRNDTSGDKKSNSIKSERKEKSSSSGVSKRGQSSGVKKSGSSTKKSSGTKSSEKESKRSSKKGGRP